MARHKSNVDFRGRNLHDRRAKRSAHHFRRDSAGGRPFFGVFHVHAQVQIGRDHAAQKRGAPAHANVHGSGHVAGNFQLRRHAGEFERHLKADLGERLRSVGGPQQKRNGERQKLQGPRWRKCTFAGSASFISALASGRREPRRESPWSFAGAKPFRSAGR